MTIAYHFVGRTLRDGTPIPPDGEWLICAGEVVICESGLHASRAPWDALHYAPGATLCKVECEDIVTEHSDKFVCRKRRIIKRIDATELLRLAACKFALAVIHLWDAPAVVREYLETGDESKRHAARDAAGSTVRCAAQDAARCATQDVVWDVALLAANAAWNAAQCAQDAAWLSMRFAQQTIFNDLVSQAFQRADTCT